MCRSAETAFPRVDLPMQAWMRPDGCAQLDRKLESLHEILQVSSDNENRKKKVKKTLMSLTGMIVDVSVLLPERVRSFF
jgi:hypothetical protein